MPSAIRSPDPPGGATLTAACANAERPAPFVLSGGGALPCPRPGEHNRRIEALITVICLALLVFCLIERQVRTQIAPRTKMPGLYAGRPARPTGWLIFPGPGRDAAHPGHR
jgi:hypothetical protein